MNTLRQQPFEDDMPDFEMGLGFGADFDVENAFYEALEGVVGDEDLTLDNKVMTMEFIVREAASDTYLEFEAFKSVVVQAQSHIEAMCASHNYDVGQRRLGSGLISGLIDSFQMDDGHGHSQGSGHSHDDTAEVDPATVKTKKKKRRGRLAYALS